MSSSRDRKPRRGGGLVVAGTCASRSRPSDDERASSRASARARSISLSDRRTRAGDGFGGSRTFGFGDALDLALRVRRAGARVSDRCDARFERERENERRKWRAFVFRKAAREIRDARARVRRDVRHGVPARPRGAPICPA